MPKLIIQEGEQQSVFELFDDEVTIGRGAASAIQVADNHASKLHAVVRRVHGRPKLVDLESKNGTRVNGEFRNQRWLEHGDVVAIGAMTLSFDGSDLAASPAVPTAAAPVVRVSPALAVAAAPAPAAPPAPRPAPVRAAGGARTRRRDEADDGEERGPRAPARRSQNNAAVLMLVGVGVLGLIALLFLLLSHSGASRNAEALAVSRDMWNRENRKEEALDFLKRNSDPTNEDGYVSVRKQIAEWEGILSHAGEDAKMKAADKAMEQIHRDFIEQWKNGLSDEQLGQRLLQFAEEFAGTPKAMELLNAQWEPFTKFRVLMEKAKAAGKK